MLIKSCALWLKTRFFKWNERFGSFLMELGLNAIKSERCIFKTKDNSIMLTFYIDDGLIICENLLKIRTFLKNLDDEFKLKVWENPLFSWSISFKERQYGNSIQQQKRAT